MPEEQQEGEFVKCKSCGGDRWTRTCVDTVRIRITEESYTDELVEQDGELYTFVCAGCGKDKIEE